MEAEDERNMGEAGMTRADWIALAERCEAATGPDQEIDEAIIAAFGGYRPLPNHYPLVWHDKDGNPLHSSCYTASLDAITALIERKLPGLKISVDQFDKTGWTARFHRPPQFAGYMVRGDAATEPLARCAALCRAKAEMCHE